ncbi:MAG: adenosylcobinamide-phosphate synthase CbiB [Cellulosilyticaceae bacterium]
MLSLTALGMGFIIDLIIGDPHCMPHPVQLIGWGITKGEAFIRKHFPKSKKGEFLGGMLLSVSIIGLAFIIPFLILKGAYHVHIGFGWSLEVLMCYQILATKALKTESMKVYAALKQKDILLARKMVSMIVGRDTQNLDEAQVAKAAIETIAENTSDGIVGPLIFLVIGGAPLGFMYKGINTLDSMIGYKNERYLYFGRFAAKTDDVFNFIPARISAYLMIAASWLCGFSGKHALKIYKRDKNNHASPNSAHTEAVCAGALNIQLAGDAYYFGKLHQKLTIGDAIRPVTQEDIKLANRLMYATCILGLVVMTFLKLWFLKGWL